MKESEKSDENFVFACIKCKKLLTELPKNCKMEEIVVLKTYCDTCFKNSPNIFKEIFCIRD